VRIAPIGHKPRVLVRNMLSDNRFVARSQDGRQVASICGEPGPTNIGPAGFLEVRIIPAFAISPW